MKESKEIDNFKKKCNVLVADITNVVRNNDIQKILLQETELLTNYSIYNNPAIMLEPFREIIVLKCRKDLTPVDNKILDEALTHFVSFLRKTYAITIEKDSNEKIRLTKEILTKGTDIIRDGIKCYIDANQECDSEKSKDMISHVDDLGKSINEILPDIVDMVNKVKNNKKNRENYQQSLEDIRQNMISISNEIENTPSTKILLDSINKELKKINDEKALKSTERKGIVKGVITTLGLAMVGIGAAIFLKNKGSDK